MDKNLYVVVQEPEWRARAAMHSSICFVMATSAIEAVNRALREHPGDFKRGFPGLQVVRARAVASGDFKLEISGVLRA